MWTKLFGTEIKGYPGLNTVDCWHSQFWHSRFQLSKESWRSGLVDNCVCGVGNLNQTHCTAGMEASPLIMVSGLSWAPSGAPQLSRVALFSKSRMCFMEEGSKLIHMGLWWRSWNESAECHGSAFSLTIIKQPGTISLAQLGIIDLVLGAVFTVQSAGISQ